MKNTRQQLRIRRHRRIRATMAGSKARPRLAVYRSNMSLYVQMIDDQVGKTLFSAFVRGNSIGKAQELGKTIAESAKKHGITTVVFDRGGYQYHGSIKALADAVREGGIIL